MKNILIATEKPFAKEALDRIKGTLSKYKDFQLNLLEKYTSKNELLKAVENAEALIVRSDKVDEEVLDAGKKLKIVVRAGAGVDNVDLKAATQRGIVVMNTPGQNANAVAELAFGLMLGLIRHKYNGTAGTELKDKKIAIHGFGNIGKRLSLIAKGFNMEVYAFDPFIDPTEITIFGASPCKSIEELYGTGDFITLNIPATPETTESINYDLLSKTKPSAFLVNTARKELIEENGLKRIIEERPHFLYASDVAPDCKDELLERFPEQIIFTSKKMGAQTAEANINSGLAAIIQIIKFFDEGDTTFQVNR